MAIGRRHVREILENESLSADEKVKGIMDLLHTETDTLRDQFDALQAEKTQLEADLQASRNETQEKHTALETARSEFEAYKTEQAENAIKSNKAKLYRAMLKEAGISDHRIETVMNVTDLSQLSLNQDGSLRNAEKIAGDIKEKWADFIPVVETNPSEVDIPPANIAPDGTTLTKEQIMGISDRRERRKAIAEHPELFGK